MLGNPAFSAFLENMASPVLSILESIAAAGKAYESEQLGSRESLIELGRDLIAALEIPSEFLQRSFWAEVRTVVSGFRPRLYTLLSTFYSQHCQRTAKLPFESNCSNTYEMLETRALFLPTSHAKLALTWNCYNASYVISSPRRLSRTPPAQSEGRL